MYLKIKTDEGGSTARLTGDIDILEENKMLLELCSITPTTLGGVLMILHSLGVIDINDALNKMKADNAIGIE